MGREGNRRTGKYGTSARRVKLALEGIYERSGYNRCGEPVPVFYNSFWKGRLGPCRNLKWSPLKPGRSGGIKKMLGSRSNPPVNILFTTMRSPWRWPLRKECRPCRCSRSSYGSRRKLFTVWDTASLQGQLTAQMQQALLLNVRSNPKTKSLTAVNGKPCCDPLPTKKIVGIHAPPFQTWHFGRTNIHEDTAYRFDAKKGHLGPDKNSHGFESRRVCRGNRETHEGPYTAAKRSHPLTCVDLTTHRSEQGVGCYVWQGTHEPTLAADALNCIQPVRPCGTGLQTERGIPRFSQA